MSAILIHLPESDPKHEMMLLSEWLDNMGFRLDTRCNGKGKCEGCKVRIRDSQDLGFVKSCQILLKDIPAETEIEIPEASRWANRISAVSSYETGGRSISPAFREGWGVSIDIGTTTVAAILWNLQNGQASETASCINSQRRFGDDIVSRISFATSNENGIQTLQFELINQTLIPLIQRLTEKTELVAGDIREIWISGNTVLLHTLMGKSLEGFGRYPFKPVFLELPPFESSTIHFPFPNAAVCLIPCAGPWIGGDVVAGAYLWQLDQPDRSRCSVLIDFGTNGEILLATPSGIFGTATAAGPAFEGGRLNCGSVAKPGVINRLERQNHKWKWHMIGETSVSPIALTATAYIDFIATGVREHWIQFNGRYNPGVPNTDLNHPSHITDNIRVSEGDIAELLQAKAAIAGGLHTLLEHAGVNIEEVSEFLIAGSFGYHLNLENAIQIGLLPNLPLERYCVVGNSSLGGVSTMLCENRLPSADGFNIRNVELNLIPSFQDHYFDALFLAT